MDLYVQLAKTLPMEQKRDMTCQLCAQLLVLSYEFGCCGMLVCDNCLKNRCPHCPDETASSAHESKRISKRVNEHVFRCIHSPCTFSGRVTDIFAHVTANPATCLYKPLQCRHCKKDFIASLLEGHEQSCDALPVNCKCGQATTRGQMEFHIRKHCPDSIVKCPYREWSGCPYQATRAKMSANHAKLTEEKCWQDHCTMAIKFIEPLKEAKEQLPQVQKENSDLKQKIAQLEREIAGLKDLIPQADQDARRAEKSIRSTTSRSVGSTRSILKNSQ